MGTFSASLRATGDIKSLAATIELADGHLSIVAGSTEIGRWPLSEIRLEEIPTGYRMAAEGEQILLEIKDLASFNAELEKASKKRFGKGRKKDERGPSAPDIEATGAAAVKTVPSPISRTSSVTPTRPETSDAPGAKTKPQTKTGSRPGLLGAVDSLLIKAKKRFGAVLPDFMFSRAMFVILIALLVVMALLPSVFSTILLIAGASLVLFGAIVYSDSVLASRWLPGRATPQQALLLGLGVLLLGVVLGMIAK
jgi:hypothetical protein